MLLLILPKLLTI